jgi:hypothetical protein
MRRAGELHNIKLEPANPQCFVCRKKLAGLFDTPALTCPYAASGHTYKCLGSCAQCYLCALLKSHLFVDAVNNPNYIYSNGKMTDW